jgi:hypothetical protein
MLHIQQGECPPTRTQKNSLTSTRKCNQRGTTHNSPEFELPKLSVNRSRHRIIHLALHASGWQRGNKAPRAVRQQAGGAWEARSHGGMNWRAGGLAGLSWMNVRSVSMSVGMNVRGVPARLRPVRAPNMEPRPGMVYFNFLPVPGFLGRHFLNPVLAQHHWVRPSPKLYNLTVIRRFLLINTSP